MAISFRTIVRTVLAGGNFDGVTPETALDAYAPSTTANTRSAYKSVQSVGRFGFGALGSKGHHPRLLKFRAYGPIGANDRVEVRSGIATDVGRGSYTAAELQLPLEPADALLSQHALGTSYGPWIQVGPTDAVCIFHDLGGVRDGTVEILEAEGPADELLKLLCCGESFLGGEPTQIDVGDLALAGLSGFAARADHQHALPAPPPPVIVDKGLADAGSATTVARSDHKHDVATDAPITVVGATNGEGVARTLARSDHRHRVEVTVFDNTNIAARPFVRFLGATVTDDAINDRADVDVRHQFEQQLIAGVGIPSGATNLSLGSVSFTTTAPTTKVRVSFTASGLLNPDGDGVASRSATVQYQLAVDGVLVPGSRRVAQLTSVTPGENAYVSFATEGVVASLAPGSHTAEIVVASASSTAPSAVMNIAPEGNLVVSW